MTIDTTTFLRDLRPVLADLREDLLVRAQLPGVRSGLHTAFSAEKTAQRTADPFDVWCRHRATQVAAAWVLSVIFVRTLEDRDLLDRRRIAGPGAEDSEQQFTSIAPFLSVRDYLLTVFRELAQLPGAAALFDGRHNPVWVLGPSANAASRLVAFFRKQDTDGALLYQFASERVADATNDTRFLGDIYQDLDEDVRKKYALLQTPDFVESFILDDTLDPAIRTFGLDKVRLIDPTCGSGHFLLGAFARLQAAWREVEPATDPQILAQRAIDQVYGCDLNPYAVAIARFRLTVAFLDASGIRRLADAPPLRLNLCVADSLLHGVSGQTGHLDSLLSADDYEDDSARQFWGADLFALEDKSEALRILSQRYHAVVGNPPYINVKDAKLRDEYRKHYKACHRGYQLVAPFTERFFGLATQRGYVGAIVGNGFMKREFGTKLIQEVLPRHDLTKVVDTSGAYIPGHGTPTVILFGRKQPPSDAPVLAVMGKRGEPSTPEDPANGEVWSSIRDHHNDLGFENDYISIAEVDRERFAKHPWTLTGGGAAELKQLLEERADRKLSDVVKEIGFGAVTREDDAYLVGLDTLQRFGVPKEECRPLVAGENIRDWSNNNPTWAIWPYSQDTLEVLNEISPGMLKLLWPLKRQLSSRVAFGMTQIERRLEWFEYSMFFNKRFRTPLSIAFAFVATHNHFVLDRGGKVFNRSAPIIKLPEDATEEDHLALLGYLNSSTAGFWMKQVMHDKGSGADKGNRQPNKAKFRYEFAGTAMAKLPVPASSRIGAGYLGRLSSKLCALSEDKARNLHNLFPEPSAFAQSESTDYTQRVREAREKDGQLLSEMVGIQEEIDWLVYSLVDLCDESVLHDEADPKSSIRPVLIGCRAFEVALARKGKLVNLDGFSMAGEIPPNLTDSERRVWESRLGAIASSKQIATIETDEFKRRWVVAPKETGGRVFTFDDALMQAAQSWLRKVIEHYLKEALAREAGSVEPVPDGTVIELLRNIPAVHQIVENCLGESDLDVGKVLADELKLASVPFCPRMMFKKNALTKYEAWKRTWEIQRREDCGEDVGSVPVPPKFTKGDFVRENFWHLRGKLNVPKERFISYPGAESDDDPSPLIGWAGWSHLERAQALAALYQQRKTEDGWEFERLTPLLAGLWELVPWLKQWHNEPSAEYGGARMGEYFEDFVSQQVREAGKTAEDLEAWRPPKRARGGRRKAGASKRRESAGRKPKVTPEQLLDAVRAMCDWDGGDGGEGASQAEVAERLGVSTQVVARVAKGLLDAGKMELISQRPKVFRYL